LGLSQHLLAQKQIRVGYGGSKVAGSDRVVITIARALLSGADLLLIGNILDTLVDEQMLMIMKVLREMVVDRGCRSLKTEYSRSPVRLKKLKTVFVCTRMPRVSSSCDAVITLDGDSHGCPVVTGNDVSWRQNQEGFTKHLMTSAMYISALERRVEFLESQAQMNRLAAMEVPTPMSRGINGAAEEARYRAKAAEAADESEAAAEWRAEADRLEAALLRQQAARVKANLERPLYQTDVRSWVDNGLDADGDVYEADIEIEIDEIKLRLAERQRGEQQDNDPVMTDSDSSEGVTAKHAGIHWLDFMNKKPEASPQVIGTDHNASIFV
jgi:hypothetical protein